MSSEAVLYVAAVALLALPLPLGLLAWRRWYAGLGAGHQRLGFALLLLVSASYLMALLGLLVPGLIGADYTNRRYITIGLNLVVLVAVLIATVVRANSRRPAGLVFSTSVLLTWAYLAVVSSAV